MPSTEIWIDNCNGDKYRTGKRTPDGKPDQSMFTTDTQPVGIQVGTAIATMVKTGRRAADGEMATVQYRDLWGMGNDKRAELIETLNADGHCRKVRQRASVSWTSGSFCPVPVCRPAMRHGRD